MVGRIYKSRVGKRFTLINNGRKPKFVYTGDVESIKGGSSRSWKKMTLEMLINENILEDTKEIDKIVLKALEEKEESTFELEMKVRRLEKGQLFIGNDGKTYKFIEMRRTRFGFTKNLESEWGSFNAKIEFIKEILTLEKSKEIMDKFNSEKESRELIKKAKEQEKQQLVELIKEDKTFTKNIKLILEEKWLYKCGLHNEGHMGILKQKYNSASIDIIIYNDGFECLAMYGTSIITKLEIQ